MMFSRFMLPAALVLASFALCVESGSLNVVPIEHPLARYGLVDTRTSYSECFNIFATDQGNTVQKMGEARKTCAANEANAKELQKKDLQDYSFKMIKIPNNFCGNIDDICREDFARTGNAFKAFECYAKSAISARLQVLGLGQDCKMKRITAENEDRLIIASKINCTNVASFEYLEESDRLYRILTTTCDSSVSDGSTSQSPIKSTTPSITDSSSAATEASSVEPETTTKKGRFPWN